MTKPRYQHVALAIMLCTLGCGQPVFAQSIPIKTGSTTWTIDSVTLELTARKDNGSTQTISEAIAHPGSLGNTTLEQVMHSVLWQWTSPDLPHLSFDCKPTTDGEGLSVTISTDTPQTFSWPVLPLAATDTSSPAHLLWPKGEGLRFDVSNPFFQKEIFGQEWDAAESLSLPLHGVQSDGHTFTWFTDSPYRNTLRFDQTTNSINLITDQHFSAKSPKMEVTYHFYLDAGTTDPLIPARHYREYLKESGQFVTLDQKVKETTSVELLRGAPHVYLWGSHPMAHQDIPRKNWLPLCKSLDNQTSQFGNAATFLKTFFTKEQLAALAEAIKTGEPYIYNIKQIAEGLSLALTSDNFRTGYPWKTADLPSEIKALADTPTSLTAAQSLRLNAHLLAAEFPGMFLPPDQWGNGDSLKMLDKLATLNVDHWKLCTPGHEDLQTRPQVAAAAARRGWLMGTYDSYHSIHDTHATAENTWSTAQMTQDLYDNASVQKENGDYIPGFRSTGRKLNSEAARSYVEDRITSNMQDVPYNYYFIDCDATGEIYDDFNPKHPLSREADAAQRLDRLRWISGTFNAVVGSEGGNAFAASSIHVGEGILNPFFGWDDPAMKDLKSPYYRGRYWPADAPDVFFKPIPLSERFQKLYYDPAHKAPMYSAVFHDSVVVTSHWNNALFKYPQVQATSELTNLLYLAPSMIHLNLDEFDKRKTELSAYLEVWAPLHKIYGFAPMTTFAYLTPDHLVQQTQFGPECTITANLGVVPHDGIPPLSARIEAKSVWTESKIYTPAQPKSPIQKE